MYKREAFLKIKDSCERKILKTFKWKKKLIFGFIADALVIASLGKCMRKEIVQIATKCHLLQKNE